MNERSTMLALTGAVAALIGWTWWTSNQDTQRRGGDTAARKVGASALYGAALDANLGIRTPWELQHWGPSVCPPHWVPHRMRYPLNPGHEIQRLIHGASAASNVTTPVELRTWLFNPPSEVDY